MKFHSVLYISLLLFCFSGSFQVFKNTLKLDRRVLNSNSLMEKCCICNNDVNDGLETNILTQKGVDGIIKCSNGDIKPEVGEKVHVKCRKDLARISNNSNRSNVNSDVCETSLPRRSSSLQFKFRENCIFCGKPAKYDRRKRGYDAMIPVRTHDFKDSIDEICLKRQDKWAEIVKGRLEYAQDLHAADTIYHSQCSINFRTFKQLPREFSDDSKRRQSGRPVDDDRNLAFLKVTDFLENNDEEQITIGELCNIMQEYLRETGEEAYSNKYMKKKLEEHFNDRIVVTTVGGTPNVVTFKRTAKAILHDFYCTPKNENEADEKKRIIRTAAELIKSDLKSMDTNNTNYPSTDDMYSVERALEFMPELLQLFIKGIVAGKNVDLKIASIARPSLDASCQTKSNSDPTSAWTGSSDAPPICL